MKKILILNNDYHVPQNTLKFAIEIAVKENATLFGLFIPKLKDKEAEGYGIPGGKNWTNTDVVTVTGGQERVDYEQAGIQSFRDTCVAAKVTFKTHIIHANFLDALVDHSAFADLIVCDGDSSPSQYTINSLVANAHCPVLLVNEDYKQVDTVIFTYDDKSSSIHAIKYFTYLFKFFNHLPVHFVSVVPHNVTGIEYEDLIREWLPLHYPNSKVELLKGDTKEELSNYINTLSNAMVVMGAFGRSSLSRFFKESLANIILKNTNAPIFITHD